MVPEVFSPVSNSNKNISIKLLMGNMLMRVFDTFVHFLSASSVNEGHPRAQLSSLRDFLEPKDLQLFMVLSSN